MNGPQIYLIAICTILWWKPSMIGFLLDWIVWLCEWYQTKQNKTRPPKKYIYMYIYDMLGWLLSNWDNHIHCNGYLRSLDVKIYGFHPIRAHTFKNMHEETGKHNLVMESTPIVVVCRWRRQNNQITCSKFHSSLKSKVAQSILKLNLNCFQCFTQLGQQNSSLSCSPSLPSLPRSKITFLSFTSCIYSHCCKKTWMRRFLKERTSFQGTRDRSSPWTSMPWNLIL